jgi:hypothetical protein
MENGTSTVIELDHNKKKTLEYRFYIISQIDRELNIFYSNKIDKWAA